MTNKTFLFWTGGTDSALLLNYLLDEISHPKHKKDELVVVLVGSNQMASGQADKMERALGAFVGNIVDRKIHLNKGILNRISICVHDMNTGGKGSVRINAVTMDKEEVEVNVKHIEHDLEFIPCLKSLVMQELVVLSSVPSLIPFLGSGKNRFVIGMCGSDLASNSFDDLKQWFDLTFKIARQMHPHDELSRRRKKLGLEPFSRISGSYMSPESIPVLEAPLLALRKQDVVMLLEKENITSYVVDKNEDLLEWYAMKDHGDISLYTKMYHDFYTKYDRPNDFPTLREFLKTETLSFTYKGGTVTISRDELKHCMGLSMMDFLARALK